MRIGISKYSTLRKYGWKKGSMFPPFRGCDFFFDVGGPEAPKLDLDIQTPLMALPSSGFIYTKPSNQIMSRVLLDFSRQTMSFFHLPSLNLTWLQKTIDGWKIKFPAWKGQVSKSMFVLGIFCWCTYINPLKTNTVGH